MGRHRRSTAKAFSWRVVAVCITTRMVYAFTRETRLAVGIGLVDSLVKVLAYHGHERLWEKTGFGRQGPTKNDYQI